MNGLKPTPKLAEAYIKVCRGLREQIASISIPEADLPPSTGPKHLEWMLEKVIDMAADWPSDKSSRWIGFIQGVMAARGWLDVKAERDRTRPIFHEAYGDKAPASVEPEKDGEQPSKS